MKKQDYSDELLLKYKDKIVPDKKTIKEILVLIGKKINLVPIDIKIQKYARIITRTRVNCFYAFTNAEKQLEKEAMELFIYEVANDNKSRSYYQSSQEHKGLEPIYIIVENQTGYIDCNCNKLLSELFLLQGVSKEDIEQKTPRLLHYLRFLDELEAYGDGEGHSR